MQLNLFANFLQCCNLHTSYFESCNSARSCYLVLIASCMPSVFFSRTYFSDTISPVVGSFVHFFSCNVLALPCSILIISHVWSMVLCKSSLNTFSFQLCCLHKVPTTEHPSVALRCFTQGTNHIL